MSLVSMLKPKGPSGFGYGSTAEDVTAGLDLRGKTYLVTGSNSGLGLETARVLALRGARVLATARTPEKARDALSGFSGTFEFFGCELSELASARQCAAQVRAKGYAIDGIIANAGIMALPTLQTKHGVELQIFTNHVGHFVLITGLLQSLSPAGRVVVLSSTAHTMAPRAGIEFDNLDGSRGYNDWRAYGQSKFANLVFAKELARRLPAGQTANAVHPGVIQTNLGRHMNVAMRVGFGATAPLFAKSIPEGAATQTWAATNAALAGTTGRYFADCNEAKSRSLADDTTLGSRLWTETEAIVTRVLG